MKKFITVFIAISMLIMTFVPFAYAADGIIGGADGFIGAGNASEVNQGELAEMINSITNVAMAIGVVVAIVVGIMLAMKFMTDGAVGKADLKTALTPYIIGVSILFGAYGIWKIILAIFYNVFS